MLKKGVYLYQYMDRWQRFNETSLPDMKEFQSNLVMEDISDSDMKKESGKTSRHIIRQVSWSVCAQQYTAISRCFWNLAQQMHWNIWILSLILLSAPRLAWQVCLKKTEIEVELLTDFNLLLMVENSIRGGMC